MYDRAVRFLDEKPSFNNCNVGPGTYDVQDFKSTKCQGYAPFSSLLARESFLTIKENSNNVVPGPGTYEPNVIFDHIKGASSLGNKSKRFDEKFNETPGPGNYDVSLDIGNKDIEVKDVIKRHTNIPRRADPPSIPCPGQAFGYEEGNDGLLRKQKAPTIDRTLGPAFYIVNQEETATVQRYKGVHFGSLTGKRIGNISCEGVPGPGTYSIHLPTTSINSIIVEEQKKKLVNAKLPRYHEIVPMMENKKAVPGPGKYELRSHFEQKEPIYDATLRPSFGSQSKRFSSAKEVTPAPDAYNDTRHALDTNMSASSSKRYPFGQSSRRFDNITHANMTPAPDSYKISGLVDDLQKKAFLSSNLKGAFGSSSVREFAFKKKPEEIPGPLHYSVQSAPAARNKDKRNAVFKSSTRRLNKAANSIPSPGSYNILRSFSKHTGSLCKVPGKPIDGGFLSSTKRFSQPRDVIVKKVDVTTPGPGNYSVKSPTTPAVSMVTNVDRFKDKENYVPGPGSYQLSPLLQHTVLKGTFNVTLNNPVESVLVEADDSSSQLSLTVTG